MDNMPVTNVPMWFVYIVIGLIHVAVIFLLFTFGKLIIDVVKADTHWLIRCSLLLVCAVVLFILTMLEYYMAHTTFLLMMV